MLDLKKKIALITGAGGHLGSEFALTLAELGANLILVDRPTSNISNIAKSLTSKYGVEVFEFYVDLEEEFSRSEFIGKIKKQFNIIDILINNAAVNADSNLQGWLEEFELQSLETWRRALEVNLTSVFHLTKEFTSLLRKSKGASVVNIGSIYGVYAPDWTLYEGLSDMGNPIAYSASKGALIHITKWLAATLGPEIRVNSLSPGGILRGQASEFIERYSKRTPLRRMAFEDDFSGAIAYLASDMSKYMTGQNIIIDGGWGI
jgi:NAD(P)-dependent dehydrogenase (short-subunit alcohol dehydrogenase family)